MTMIFRRVPILAASLILLLIATVLPADDTSSGIERSVAVVFDLSFSMTIVEPGTSTSRYRLGLAAVEKLVGDMEGTEWALILADGPGDFELAVGFTEDREELLAGFQNQEPWGITPLEEMVHTGLEYLLAEGTGDEKFLLLVSDCINTFGGVYTFPILATLEDVKVMPVVLGFPVVEYEGFRERASAWVEDAGGYFFFHHQVSQLRNVLADGATEESTPVVDTPPPEPVPEPPVVVRQAKEPIYFPIWWIFLLPLVGLGGYCGYLFSKWQKKKRQILSLVREPETIITLGVSVRGGESEERTFSGFPVKVAASGKADLILPKPRIGGGARTFSITGEGDRTRFLARGMFVINGVGKRHAELKVGDRITYGRYRITFGGVRHETPPAPKIPVPWFLLFLPLLGVFVVLSVIFRHPVVIQRRPEPPISREFVPSHEASNGTKEDAPSGNEEPRRIVVGPSPKEIEGFPTVMWGPDSPPDFFKIDALFVHAHPDDESLDFGVLAGRLSNAGKKVAVVLFTDGDSGLDQYPWRPVGGVYPSYDLKGEDLAAVRHDEARQAMSILGVNHYVRLGLRNHPYNGGLDVLSAKSVIDAWGGEDKLVERLAEIILGYRPEIVVSPEGPTDAFEHFEHEAVGLIVERTIGSLEADGRYRPAGRLVSVDPLQKGHFTDAIGIDATGFHAQSGLPFRAVQASALGKHLTQRDASVIGIENLSSFDSEYYRVFRWDMDGTVEDYLEPSLR